jgi:hypothetical protein
VFYPLVRLGKIKMQTLTTLTQIVFPMIAVALAIFSIGWIRNW